MAFIINLNCFTREQIGDAAHQDHEKRGPVVEPDGVALDDDGPQVA